VTASLLILTVVTAFFFSFGAVTAFFFNCAVPTLFLGRVAAYAVPLKAMNRASTPTWCWRR
jgi:hypothetical protein